MSEPAPAPSLVLNVTADKPSYKPGDELVITVEALAQVTDLVTVSGTDAAGDTVTSQVPVTVLAPASGVQFGVSDAFGGSFTQEAGDGGTVVFKTVLAPPAS